MEDNRIDRERIDHQYQEWKADPTTGLIDRNVTNEPLPLRSSGLVLQTDRAIEKRKTSEA